ncbi:MAG: hypothetical protein IMHGJWDQ_001851 [Candidatus Fervidibacter sp.]
MQKEATPSLKLGTIDRPRQHGCCLIVIHNASTNAALLALSKGLGFRRQAGWDDHEAVFAHRAGGITCQ